MLNPIISLCSRTKEWKKKKCLYFIQEKKKVWENIYVTWKIEIVFLLKKLKETDIFQYLFSFFFYF